MQINQLIYASVARPGIGYDDFSQILASAGVHNKANGISGILCYSAGAFLQAIEGERVAINQLYNKIVKDERHSSTEILSCGPIEARSFVEWSMKMISWDESYTPQRRALVLRHTGVQHFEPWTMSAKQAHSFLCELAELERRKDRKKRADLSTV